jgi:hypothetical protein
MTGRPSDYTPEPAALICERITQGESLRSVCRDDAMRAPGEGSGEGMLAVCIREVQKTLADSSKRLVEKKISELRVGSEFRVWRDRIETPRGRRDHLPGDARSDRQIGAILGTRIRRHVAGDLAAC